ncbi:ATP-binding cassette domain-containing protein [Lactobacillaceae bacterium L1_55_11]|nr:ATP-binding cassette domain-containing protein [Lactobacillaceae bacterium L1_55_11]
MLLEVKNLSVDPILAGINLTVNQDDWLTITGPSGGGKSTLLRALARLQDGVRGQIDLAGKSASDYDLSTYRQQVSYAVQSASLFGHTVRNNLDLPFQVRQVPVNLDRQLELLEKVDLPSDYLDKPITDLSGGQRQRVGLLRNLVFPPQVLLLDEITTGLDAQTKEVVWRLVKMSQTDHHLAIISVTHDSQEIAAANRLLTVKEGHLDD